MNKTKTYKIFGVAGSGKTTYCIDIIKYLIGYEDNIILNKDIKKQFKDIENKYLFEDICFTSFTRSALQSVKDKIKEDLNFEVKSHHNFKTLNSLTWCMCGFEKEHQITNSEKINFFNENNVKTTCNEQEISEMDVIINVYNNIIKHYARNIDEIKDIEIRTYYDDKYKESGFIYPETDFVIQKIYEYYRWKIQNNKKDYIDSEIECLKNKIDIPNKILIVDEAQDLSYLETKLIKLWVEEYNRDIFIIAGDDDQTVHVWAGAKPEFLINYQKDNANKIILQNSHRLSSNVSKLCNDILKTINFREKKTVISDKPKSNIEYININNEFEILKLIKKHIEKGSETKYILFRTNKVKQDIEKYMFRNSNVIFAPINPKSNMVSSLWSIKLISICNILNKLNNNMNVYKYEILHLFDVLKKCPILKRGSKKKVNDSKKLEYTTSEFIDLTTLGKGKQQLDIFTSIDFKKESGNIKDKIIRYIEYKGTITDNDLKDREKLNKKTELNDIYKEKIRSINEIIKIDINLKEIQDIKVRCGTYHSSKGLDSDKVILFLGTSYKFREIDDNERRVFYVGCSRSKGDLIFVSSFGTSKPYLENEFKEIILYNLYKK